jgi:ribonuclease M5
VIITTDGFGVFKNDEKASLLRKLASEEKIIVVTDSDGAGRVIRNFIRGIIPAEKIVNLYIPQIKGKEKRKEKPSAEGTLGVEGMTAELLHKIFLPYTGEIKNKLSLKKTDFFVLGLSGGDNSSYLRRKFCTAAGLPAEMSANALLEAVNLLFDEETFYKILEDVK